MHLDKQGIHIFVSSRPVIDNGFDGLHHYLLSDVKSQIVVDHCWVLTFIQSSRDKGLAFLHDRETLLELLVERFRCFEAVSSELLHRRVIFLLKPHRSIARIEGRTPLLMSKEPSGGRLND